MINLLELPTDILLVIFSYIPSVHLIRSLSVVCVQFRDILNSESFWKRRYNQKSGLTLNSLRNWKLGCCQNDNLQRIIEERTTIDVFKGCTATLDTVHIMPGERIVAGGARNGRVYMWDITSSKQIDFPANTDHKGWVWCLSSCREEPTMLYSGSFDNNVKLWDINQQALVYCIRKVHKSAVLCMDCSVANSLTTGSFDKQLRLFDTRDLSSGPVLRGRAHDRAVLCLQVDGNRVISGSENSVSVWDWRSNKQLQMIRTGSLVQCLYYSNGLLMTGGKHVSCYQESSNGQFNHVTDCKDLHQRNGITSTKITGIYHNLGMAVTCSEDKTVKFHRHLHNGSLQPVYVLEHHQDTVTKLHYRNGVLAMVSADEKASVLTLD